MSELKACPFCGGVGVLEDVDLDEYDPHCETWYQVLCTKCYAASRKYLSPEEAAEAWNRRCE